MTERGYIFKYECQNETDPNRQGKLCGLSYMHGKKEKKGGSGGVGRRGERKNETPANEAWKAVYRFTAGVYV